MLPGIMAEVSGEENDTLAFQSSSNYLSSERDAIGNVGPLCRYGERVHVVVRLRPLRNAKQTGETSKNNDSAMGCQDWTKQGDSEQNDNKYHQKLNNNGEGVSYQETAGAVEVTSLQELVLYRSRHGPQAFRFDRILGENATQADVYDSAAQEIVSDVLKGYNGTILAYGQTGAGKTHTLSSIRTESIGIIPRAAQQVFGEASIENGYRVRLSYLQIYCEQIQDLLRPETGDNLAIRETGDGRVCVPELSEIEVTSLDDCLRLLQLGERNRTVAFTALNAHSSRSHAVVIMTVSRDAHGNGLGHVGKLYLVDLAGSERLKKSKSTGQRAYEARAINLSLTTLGKCVSARALGPSKHVPFRDSKLTRLLQDSLGGNAKTCMIIAIAGAVEHSEETLQALQFGSRAMHVQTHAEVNREVPSKEFLSTNAISSMEDTLKNSLLEREAQLEDAFTQLRVEQEHSKKVIESLQRERSLAAEERKYMEQEHEQAVKEERERSLMLQEQMRSTTARLAEVETSSKEKIDALRQQLDEALIHIDQIERAYEEKERDLNNTVKALEQQKKDELANTQQIYQSQIQAQEKDWKSKMLILDVTLEEKSSLIERLEIEKNNLQQDLKIEQQTRSRDTDQMRVLENQVSAFETDMPLLRAKIEYLEQQIHKKGSECAILEESCAKAVREKDARIARQTHEAEDRYQAMVSKYESSTQELQGVIERSHEKLNDTRKVLRRLEEDSLKLREENTRLREELQAAEAHKQKYKKAAKESEFKFDVLSRHYQKFEIENNAARKIQRAYREYRAELFRRQRAAKYEELAKTKVALGDLAAQHAEMAAKRESNLAFAGHTLLGEGLEVLQDAVEGLLTAFLLPSKDLKALQRYKMSNLGTRSTMPMMNMHAQGNFGILHPQIENVFQDDAKIPAAYNVISKDSNKNV